MSTIILDCDLMKFPNSGLYHYCLNMGQEVNKLLLKQQKQPMRLYLPSREHAMLAPDNFHIIEKKWHKFWKPFLNECKVWHAPFQSGRILPEREKNRNTRVLLTVHDLNALHEGKSPEIQRKSLAHTQSLIDRSDAIVCISEFTRNDVIQNCEVGDKPVYVIHNGLHKVGNPALLAESYRPTRPFLFGLGYINAKKNYHVLLPILEDNPEMELVISGRLDEPSYVNKIETLAAKMGVSDRLRITGPITEGEKAWYLENCEAFLHPSLAEGFGATIVEAMSFGKPIFISNLTSLPEIGGNVSFYFNTFEGDHMKQVFREGMHTYAKSNLDELLKLRADEFSREKSAAKYLDVYQSLL